MEASVELIFNDTMKLSYNKIIVTGPQRSGTRFVGMLLNNRLENYNYSNQDINIIYKLPDRPVILHTPAQSHKIHNLLRGTRIKTLVVWVDRNNEDVIESEDRNCPLPKWLRDKHPMYTEASWHDRCFEREERPKYLKTFPEHEEKIKSFDRNVHMKKWVWENIQRDNMKVDFTEVKYESLKDLTEFVPKEQRKDWNVKQVRENGKNAYNPNY